MNDSFGTLLFEYRKTRDLSQKKIAERSDLHDSYISLLELSKRDSPSREVVYRLSDALELTDAEKNALLLSAGYAPGDLRSLLFEPTLADLDDVMSNVPLAYADEFRELISNAINLGRELISSANEGDTG